MKKRYTILAALLLASQGSFAQEFKLPIHLAGHNFDKTVVIGYDANAVDTSSKADEAAYGEDLQYPGGIGFGSDLFLTRTADLSNTLIDIRKKPDSTSFQIVYRMNLSLEGDRLPGVLSWNPADIPSGITSLTVAPAAAPQAIRADMMKQSSIAITADSLLYYQTALITLTYGTPLAVERQRARNFHLSANPWQQQTALSFDAPRPSMVLLTAYDVSGKILLNDRFYAKQGANVLTVSKSDIRGYTGPMFVRMVSVDGSMNQSFRMISE